MHLVAGLDTLVVLGLRERERKETLLLEVLVEV